MNRYVGFCLKCGNPRNPGELKCRFCGEAFNDNSSGLNLESNQSAINPDDNDVFTIEDLNDDDNSAVIIDDKISNQETKTHDDNIVNDIDTDHTITSNPIQSQTESDNTSEGRAITPVDIIRTNIKNEETLNPSLEKKETTKYYKISKNKFWTFSTLLLILLLLTTCFIIYKCTQKDSPSDVVKKSFECLKHKDYDSFLSYMDLSNKSKSFMHDLCPKIMKWYVEDIEHIDIESEHIDENEESAVVYVNLVFKDKKQKKSEVKLVKIKEEWKIKPFGDYDLGIESIINLGRLFGFDMNNSFPNNILDVFGQLF